MTSKDDEIDEVLGLRMGADDYVKKPFSQRLLVERIRALLRRQDVIGGEVVEETEDNKVMVRGELTMDPLRHAVKWKGNDVSLTVTEFLLLQALAQRPGFVKSRDQLMDVAYDDQIYVDDRTIDSHIKRLRKKMRQADDEFSAIETLYGIGYRYKRSLIMSEAARHIDVRDLNSVRRAARNEPDLVLGDDWIGATIGKRAGNAAPSQKAADGEPTVLSDCAQNHYFQFVSHDFARVRRALLEPVAR